jgi:hypothetical protein
MIDETRIDLEDRLETIDTRLKSLSLQKSKINKDDSQNRSEFQQERLTTTQCLQICTEVSIHIDQVRLGVLKDISTPSDATQGPVTSLDGLLSARLATDIALSSCKTTLKDTSIRLEKQLREIEFHIEARTENETVTSGSQDDELQKSQQDYDSVKQALSICSEASERAAEIRTNYFEDVKMAEDGNQVIVSTIGDLISAKRISAGPRSNQWLGQMSDESLQGLTNTFAIEKLTNMQSNTPEGGKAFDSRYGTGFKLNRVDSPPTVGAKASSG